MSDEIANLKHALAVANNWVEHHQNHCDDLIKENAALRERLEQLQDFAVLVLRGLDSGYIRSKPFIDTSDDNATEYPVRTLEEIARAALARKEAQP